VIGKKESVKMEKINFGLLQRRWNTFDWLVVCGHEELTDHFFMCGIRQLGEFSSTLAWGVFGVHHPEQRMLKIMNAVDLSWMKSSEPNYHGSVTVGDVARKHYHFVGVRSFSVPEIVKSGKHRQTLGFYSAPRRDFDISLFPNTLRQPAAQLMNIFVARRAA
jgi:hypothetical protein